MERPMRRSVPALLMWCIVTASVVIVPAAATAQALSAGTDPAAGLDLPPGFTDGQPVGGTDAPSSAVPVAPSGAAAGTSAVGTSASSTTRYFGEGPWTAIEAATAATDRCTGLDAPVLTALVTSPVFKESSAATSASTAPAPMPFHSS